MRINDYGFNPSQLLERMRAQQPTPLRSEGVGSANLGETLGEVGKATKPDSSNMFSDMLTRAIQDDATAAREVDRYARGESQNLDGTMVALSKADISVSLLVTVRNRLIEAYRDVMRMG